MKILHTADWHIGQFKGPVEDGVNLRSLDTIKCLEYMVKVAEEEKPDMVCISGDIFHQEQIGPVRYSDEMVTATRIIEGLAERSKFVVVMRGTPNHDGAGQFRVLEKMLSKNKKIAVVTTPQVISTPIADVACIPGFDKQEFRAKFPGLSAEEENLTWTKYISDMVMGLRAQCSNTNIIPDMTPAILMAHYTVPGCNMESGQTSFFSNFEPVIPREAIQAADYSAVLLGHIHRPQTIEGLENVFYSGAINAMNFNDEGQSRGFWIHEFDGRRLKSGKRYETPYRKFQTVTWAQEDVENYLCRGKEFLFTEVFPIYDWTNNDVWLYLKQEKVDIPEIYLFLWQSGSSKQQLRVSQFFSVDTARSLVKMNEYYPDLMERIIRREPNAYLAALYWDSEMFGRSSRKRRTMEDGAKEKDYKKELIYMFSNMDVFFDTPHKRNIAERYRNFFLQVSAIAKQEDFKHIYEGLISGDPKMRTFRALYHRIYGKYISEAKKTEESRHGK